MNVTLSHNFMTFIAFNNLSYHLFCFYFIFSAGIGRTGALITIDAALGLMERDLSVCGCSVIKCIEGFISVTLLSLGAAEKRV